MKACKVKHMPHSSYWVTCKLFETSYRRTNGFRNFIAIAGKLQHNKKACLLYTGCRYRKTFSKLVPINILLHSRGQDWTRCEKPSRISRGAMAVSFVNSHARAALITIIVGPKIVSMSVMYVRSVVVGLIVKMLEAVILCLINAISAAIFKTYLLCAIGQRQPNVQGLHLLP
jgi:hypothetical protein